jgi:hypothetical protein
MKIDRRSIVTVVAVIAALSLGACADAPAEEEEGSREATVEEIDGSEVSRVTLTEDAVRRLDVQTEEIATVGGGGTQIPYGAVLYDPAGDAWAFVNPESRTYVREPIEVDHIVGDVVYLADGPPVGTRVVTVGAPELYGSEIGVGDE